MEQVQVFLVGFLTVAAAVVGLVSVAFKFLSRGAEFHDRHIVRKYFERLRVLRECASEGTLFSDYLDASIKLESFRIASGISTNLVKMEYILELARLGRWDRGQLRALSSYIRLMPGSLRAELYIGRVHVFDGFFSLFGGAYFVFAGIFFLVYLGVFFGAPLGWFAGGVVCLAFFVCALGMWRGFVSYQIAKNAKRYLELAEEGNADAASSVVGPPEMVSPNSPDHLVGQPG